ncbi:MAG: hypothetical protein AB1568_13440 [Thermodesulfobacteriota bacterium]
MRDSFAQMAATFMAWYFQGKDPDMAAVDRICEAALADGRAVAALYRGIVEGLCDDFTERGMLVCNEVLLRILGRVLTLPEGRELAGFLRHQGCASGEALRNRHAGLVRRPPAPAVRRLRRILLLSRVTIGADVLINGILIQRLCRLHPGAEIVCIGPPHMREVFAHPSVRFRDISYDRHGSLQTRVIQCLEVCAIVQQERQGLAAGEVVLVDPDSRLSQLGLLPLAAAEETLYFPSRAVGGETCSLVALTNRWLDQWAGQGDFCFPRTWFPDRCLAYARHLMLTLPAQPLVVMNFGVGGSAVKRVRDPFEERLIGALLRRGPVTVILDSGKSPAGRQRVEAHLETLRGRYPVGFFCEGGLPEAQTAGPLLLGFEGSIGAIGAIIAGAAAFFGYDSCCQHLAAANCTPATVIFGGAPSRRFYHRWRPVSPVGRIHAMPLAGGQEIDLQGVVNLVEETANSLWRQAAAP